MTTTDPTFDPAQRRVQLAEARAREQQAQSMALAALPQPVQAAVAQSQRPDPLASLLDRAPHAAHPPLPPAELAREHSTELAELISEAAAARARQGRAIAAWREAQPGTRAFLAAAGSADADEIVQLIVFEPARRWAEAWVSIREAEQAAQAVRDFGRHEEALHVALEERIGELTARVVDHLRQARDRRQRLPLAQADGLLAEWRQVRSLQRWCLQIDPGWRPLGDNACPLELVSLYRDALRANGEEIEDETREGVITPDGRLIVTSGPPPEWEDPDDEPIEPAELAEPRRWEPVRQLLGRT